MRALNRLWSHPIGSRCEIAQPLAKNAERSCDQGPDLNFPICVGELRADRRKVEARPNFRQSHLPDCLILQENFKWPFALHRTLFPNRNYARWLTARRALLSLPRSIFVTKVY